MPRDVSPAQPSATPATVRQRVESVIELMRPIVQSDGGDVELLDVSAEGVVRLRLHGACVGCPSVTMSLQGIERYIREKVPEVSQVVGVEH